MTEKAPITFITGNKGKLLEVTNILNSLGDNFNITNQNIDLKETPEQISRLKAIEATTFLDGPVFVEDTSLCFNALGGLPGPYIKWFMDSCKCEGVQKLLHGFEDKTGYALCVLAYTEGKGKDVHIFTGRVDGKIVEPRRGKGGFGWDPIFEPLESNGETFSEMSQESKDRISHRRRAVEQFRDFLRSQQAQ